MHQYYVFAFWLFWSDASLVLSKVEMPCYSSFFFYLTQLTFELYSISPIAILISAYHKGKPKDLKQAYSTTIFCLLLVFYVGCKCQTLEIEATQTSTLKVDDSP